jgi:hypothetical protein
MDCEQGLDSALTCTAAKAANPLILLLAPFPDKTPQHRIASFHRVHGPAKQRASTNQAHYGTTQRRR